MGIIGVINEADLSGWQLGGDGDSEVLHIEGEVIELQVLEEDAGHSALFTQEGVPELVVRDHLKHVLTRVSHRILDVQLRRP